MKIDRYLPDDEIIDLMRLREKIEAHPDNRSFDDVTADEFNGLGIINLSHGVTVVVHRNIGYTCSFEGTNLYPFDLRLQALSEEGEVLSFLSNPFSDTYAYAFFKEGSRIANQAMAGGELLEGSPESKELGHIILSENGIMALMEKVGNFYYDELIELPKSEIRAYHPV